MLRLSAIPVLLLAFSLATAGRSFAGAEVVYDFVSHFGHAKIMNALNPNAAESTAAGVKKRSIFLHPTQSDAAATYLVTLPNVSTGERLIFAYSAGVRDGVKIEDPVHPFLGVRMTLAIDGKEQFAAEIKEPKWVDGATDLTPMAGHQVEVLLTTHALKTTDFNWAAWGEPRILKVSNGVLRKGGNQAPAAKGLVVVDYMGNNGVQVTPTGIPGGRATSAPSVTWSAPMGAREMQPGVAVIPFDFTDIGATGVEIALTDMIGNIQVYEFDPKLKIVSFGPANALLFADRPTEFRCVVRNVGEGIARASSRAEATLSASFATVPQPIGDLLPGAQKTLAWSSVKLPVGPCKASVAVSGQAIAKVSSAWEGEVVKASVPVPPTVAGAECKRLSDGSVLLQNPKLRMIFLKGRDGYAGWIAYAPQGAAWKPVASGSPLGRVAAPTTYRLHPQDVKLVNGPAPAVHFTTTKPIHDVPCSFEWTFALDQKEPRVSMSFSMKSASPVDILHFSGPMVYAGDRGFGRAKDDALFPGLEYLLTESSSGTENAHPPFNLRTVPHPNKITIPLMAVRKGSTLVSLEWDPLQKWDGSADRPAAVFASPNFLDGEDNHKMGIFAPSVPTWTDENHELAAKPYTLEPGKPLTLTADLIVRQNSKDILDAVDAWVARHDLPANIEPQTPEQEWNDFCETAYKGPAWDDAAKAWKHTNTGPVFFDPIIANVLYNHAEYTLDEDDYRKRLALVLPAVVKARDSLTPDVALFAGGVEGALNRMGERVTSRIAAQRPDGSWAFAPDKAHEVFGRPGDTSSGFTATNAIEILHYALVTGDPKAREAGLKALAYMDTQTRPEGAQVWELQLHVPDILASARLIDAFLCGYQLTDDKKYLDSAVHWAKSGIPFVYLWNAPDRPIMRYGTIPVFGVTYFDAQPWFANCVQWCGLEYGYELDRLVYFDKTMDWHKIAGGILKCGIQQQEYITKKYPQDTGMYPDAFSVLTGEEAYHWDLNPRMISRSIWGYWGADGFPRTATVVETHGIRLAVTAPVSSIKLKLETDLLTIDMTGGPMGEIYMVLSGIHGPVMGPLGRNFQSYNDLTKVPEGFTYIAEKELTIVKLRAAEHIHFMVDLLVHNRYETGIRHP